MSGGTGRIGVFASTRGRSRRAQLAIFIILGLLALILVSMAFYAINRQSASTTEGRQDQVVNAEEVQQRVGAFVDSCIRSEVGKVVFQMAPQGGTLVPRGSIFGRHGIVIDTWASDVKGKWYVNQARTRDTVAKEMSARLGLTLSQCLAGLPAAISPSGGAQLSVKPPIAYVTINPEDVTVRLRYEGTMQVGPVSATLSEFVTNVQIPFGRMLQMGEDIVNAEARDGYFSKEMYMLKIGADVVVEKDRPYPHTRYYLSQKVPGFNATLMLAFALQGRDTVFKETRYVSSSLGCCQLASSDCLANVDQLYCMSMGGTYNNTASCSCPIQAKPAVKGCCLFADESCGYATQAEDCNGTFYPGDITCQGRQVRGFCDNLVCRNLSYSYAKYFGGMRTGEAWCTTDSPAGLGVDFVGDRHYLHSCINGKEIVEPCRDFREEICVSSFDQGTMMNRATCRTNRWYDCAAQGGKSSCEDKTRRDCVWMPSFGRYLTLYSKVSCVPLTPPGARFWQNQGITQCSLVNDKVKKKRPRAQGFNILQICSRLGDCGDKRNFVGLLGKGGYYHPKQKPSTAHYNAYSLAGFGAPDPADDAALAHMYSMRTFIDKLLPGILSEDFLWQKVDPATQLPAGTGGGQVKCGPWKPPPVGPCERCNTFPLRPCTEYRCKSIGLNCVWRENKIGLGFCEGPGASNDLTGPRLTLNTQSANFQFVRDTEASTETLTVFTVDPALQPTTLIDFGVDTDEKTLCSLSTFPPGTASGGIDSLEVDISQETIEQAQKALTGIGDAQLEELLMAEEEPTQEQIDALPPEKRALYLQLRAILDSDEDPTAAQLAALPAEALIMLQQMESGVGEGAVILPMSEVQMGTGEFETKHPTSFFSPTADVLLTIAQTVGSLPLFIGCQDESGNLGQNAIMLKFQLTNETVNDTKGPEVVIAKAVGDAEGNYTLLLAMNEPVEQCRVGNAGLLFDQMGAVEGCGVALGYSYTDWAPPGATTCELPLPSGDAIPRMVACKDLAGNVGVPVEITVEESGQTPSNQIL